MVLNILETPKKPNKAFLKFKAIRILLESFKPKLIQFSNFSSEKESERFSKKNTQDFLKKYSFQSTNLFIKAVAEASLYFKINSICLH